MDELKLADLARDPFVQTGVLAVVGVLVTRVLLRRYPAQRLVFQLAFFVALTALLYHHDIVPYQIAPERTPDFERVFLALAIIISASIGLAGCFHHEQAVATTPLK